MKTIEEKILEKKIEISKGKIKIIEIKKAILEAKLRMLSL